jgi:hypothetical protein
MLVFGIAVLVSKARFLFAFFRFHLFILWIEHLLLTAKFAAPGSRRIFGGRPFFV